MTQTVTPTTKTFILDNLSLDEVNLILSGLGELPLKHSMNLVQKIQTQVVPQVKSEPTPIPMSSPPTDES